MSTGCGVFAILGRKFDQFFFPQIVSLREKTLKNTNLVPSRHFRRVKDSLLVAVHYSKMSLLISFLIMKLQQQWQACKAQFSVEIAYKYHHTTNVDTWWEWQCHCRLYKKKGWFIYAIIYKLAFDQWSPPHVQTWFHSVKQELVHLQAIYSHIATLKLGTFTCKSIKMNDFQGPKINFKNFQGPLKFKGLQGFSRWLGTLTVK